jgi:hypothetical protein
MSDKEKQDENLKPFEAALAALRPRTDRLDGQWRELLAKEAALTAELSTLPSGEGQGKDCDVLGGHQFVCVRCGSAAPASSVMRHWAWPTAMAGMTTVAAILLILLVVPHNPPAATPVVVQKPASPSSSEKVQMADFRLATSGRTRSPLASGVGDAPYLRLREQILRDGVESWKPSVSEVVTAVRATEAPLSYKEQLQRLLEQQGLRGS